MVSKTYFLSSTKMVTNTTPHRFQHNFFWRAVNWHITLRHTTVLEPIITTHHATRVLKRSWLNLSETTSRASLSAGNGSRCSPWPWKFHIKQVSPVILHPSAIGVRFTVTFSRQIWLTFRSPVCSPAAPLRVSSPEDQTNPSTQPRPSFTPLALR